MKAISLIVTQLKNRQAQIERKINQLRDQNLDQLKDWKKEKS
ncbi:hypothetical protein [Cyclobacterium sp.]|jgi:hypothetical protein|nr:hypothetical protein [Cyclobacterium sp.]